jgi:nitrate/nitrite transport system ATP-binding protein
MMTNGPAATIGEILSIELPRPRDRIKLADNPMYNKYRHQVLQFLYEKQRKVEPVFNAKAKQDASNKQSIDAA